jgi:hypothetical protein
MHHLIILLDALIQDTIKNQAVSRFRNSFFYWIILGHAMVLSGCSATSEHNAKVKGFCLESPPMKVEQNQMKAIADVNAEWVAVIPYGYTMPGQSQVVYNSDSQWWGERFDGAAELIQSAKAEGLKVMLKPQVWIPRMWVGDFYPDDMDAWQESMSAFTLDFAGLADSLDVEIFCLATEYKKLTIEHPAYFEELIGKIREVYAGKLTYAANWDEYTSITFWDKLDYIGVNAYFPLSEKDMPTEEELTTVWNEISLELSSVSLEVQRPILFTEFGYRSIEKTTEKPWEHGRATYEPVAQSVAFQALFKSVWQEPWMAGGFIWKWRFFEEAGGHGDASYTPQGKPAMKVIEEHFE